MSPILIKYSHGWSPFILHLLKNIVTDKTRGFSAIQIRVFDFNWKDLLANYPTAHPLDVEFRDIQTLYADWMGAPSTWLPSTTDSLRLDQIAHSEGPQAGYAASLLNLYYGLVILPTWRTSPPPAEPRSDDQYYTQKPSQKSGMIKVYPNPSTGQFTYAVEGMMEMEKLIFMNPLGQVVLNIDHPQNNGKLDLGTLAHGMFLLWAQSKDGTVATAHIIIQP